MPRKLWVGGAIMLASTIATTAFADDAPPTSPSEDITTTEAFAPPAAPPAQERVIVAGHERPRRALLLTGAALFVGTYALTASFAGASERAGDRDLFIPGAGPFINLSNRNCARGCVTTTSDVALILTSGILQNIGAGMMILSALFPERVPERVAQGRAPVASVTTTTSARSSAAGGDLYVDRVEDSGPNRTLLWSGVTVFALSYTGSVVAGTVAGDRVPDKNLFIPLVGPWLDLGQRNCDFRRCDDVEEGWWKAAIIGAGVAQGVGAVLAVSSFVVPERRTTLRSAMLRSTMAAKPEIHFAPISYAGGAGIGALGRF